METTVAKTEITNELMIPSSSELQVKQLANATQVMELTASYLKIDEWEIGEEKRFYFKGLTNIKGERGDDVQAVRLHDGEAMYINSNVTIVGSCSGLPINAIVSIAYLGKEKSNKGTYFKTKVNLLKA